MAGYSGTPLHRKLGIVPESRVLLDGAPSGFDLDVPDGVRLSRRPGSGPYDVILCFCPDRARLVRRWPALHPLTTPAGALWIAWPKRASKVATDMSDNVIREIALPTGLVDNKVCAIDQTWTGLRLVIRRELR